MERHSPFFCPDTSSSPPAPDCRSDAAHALRGIILVAFGTRQDPAFAAYRALEQSFRDAFPEHVIVWAFTSSFIRKKLGEQGKPVMSVGQALDYMAAQGVRDVVVQSLHILAGEEFAYMERSSHAAMLRQPDSFDSVRIARPLLESRQDCEEAVDAVLASLPPQRRPDEAVLIMAHGHRQGRGDLVLSALEHRLGQRDPLVFTASIEGTRSFDEMAGLLCAGGIKRAWLVPFMLVAGEHAKSDMMGEHPGSWASRLHALGIDAIGLAGGLGENEAIRNIFIRHARETRDDLARPKDRPQS